MKSLTQEETLALIPLAQAGDKQAQNDLVEGHQALARAVSNRFANRGLDYDDLFQVGCLGLFKAIMRFDPSYGVMFSTYAVPMIAGEIKRFLRDDGPIKVSRSLRELATKAFTVKREWENRTGSEISLSQLAQELNVSPEELAAALDAMRPVSSLQEPVGSGDDQRTYIDQVADPKAGEELAVDKMLLRQLLETLNDREKQIILLRYFRGKTQTEIAKTIGVSQVQVSRLEAKILEKLRKMAI